MCTEYKHEEMFLILSAFPNKDHKNYTATPSDSVTQ